MVHNIISHNFIGRVGPQTSKKRRAKNGFDLQTNSSAPAAGNDEIQLDFSPEFGYLKVKLEIVDDQDLVWANQDMGDNGQFQLKGEFPFEHVNFDNYANSDEVSFCYNKTVYLKRLVHLIESR